MKKTNKKRAILSYSQRRTELIKVSKEYLEGKATAKSVINVNRKYGTDYRSAFLEIARRELQIERSGATNDAVPPHSETK